MVAVTLPVQWAWTGLRARGTRHQTGREDTRPGLRLLHRGNFQEKAGRDCKASAETGAVRVPLPGVPRVVSDVHWPARGYGQLYLHKLLKVIC